MDDLLESLLTLVVEGADRGIISRVPATGATARKLNKEWSDLYEKQYGESTGPFWNTKGEKNPYYYTVRNTEGRLVAGATAVQSGVALDILSIGSHMKRQGKLILDELKKKNIFLQAMASTEKAKQWFVSQGFIEVIDKPGLYNVLWNKQKEDYPEII